MPGTETRARRIPISGLIGAEFLSLLGNQIAAVAIPILVLQFTGSALAAGIAAIGNVLPMFAAAFIGGRAIDRYGAWRLSIVADVLSGLSTLMLPLVFLWFGAVSPGWIFLLVLAGALFDPTGVAARQTLVPSLTRFAREPLRRVNALRGGLENAADFAGPLLAVALIAVFGVGHALFVNAASFLLCALLFASTVPRRSRTVRPAVAVNLLVGVRFLFGDPALRSLALMGALVGAVLLPFIGLMLPVLAVQTFHNATLLGICLTAFGGSATLAAVGFAWLARYLTRSMIYYGGLALGGLAIAVCGIVTQRWGVVLGSALAGLAVGAGNPLEQTILQQVTPRAIAGQVFTALGAIRFGAGPFGLLAAGIATEWFGPAAVLLTGGVFLAGVALLGWRASPLPNSKA